MILSVRSISKVAAEKASLLRLGERDIEQERPYIFGNSQRALRRESTKAEGFALIEAESANLEISRMACFLDVSRARLHQSRKVTNRVLMTQREQDRVRLSDRVLEI